jgi:hypothetical protein
VLRVILRKFLVGTDARELTSLSEWVIATVAAIQRQVIQQAYHRGFRQGYQAEQRSAYREVHATVLALWRARFGEPDSGVLAVLEAQPDLRALLSLIVPLALAEDARAARVPLGLEAAPAAGE